MRNVTNRIKEVTQPRGGYIKPSSMASEKLEDGACRTCCGLSDAFYDGF